MSTEKEESVSVPSKASRVELNKLKRMKLEEEAYKERTQKAEKQVNFLLKYCESYCSHVKRQMEHVEKKGSRKRIKLTPTATDLKKAFTTKESNKENYPVEEPSVLDSYEEEEDQFALKYFTGTLRPYQVEGVKWLINLYNSAINGILADEMGLGKTIQVIALICKLLEQNISGPFLIVVPLSTLPNWKTEFARFAPNIPVVTYYGLADSFIPLRRHIKKKYEIGQQHHQTGPVVLTPHHFISKESAFLSRTQWHYIIVDEGHRLKNDESQFFRLLNEFKTSNKLLLTGTPLQNNIKELWSLLHFLMPEVFRNLESLAMFVMVEDIQDENRFLEQEKKAGIISKLHKILAPFMLRRLKKDVLHDLVPKKEVIVFCDMTEQQQKLYESVIERSINFLLDKEKDEDIVVHGKKRRKRKCTEGRKFYKIDDDFVDAEEFIEDSLEVIDSGADVGVRYKTRLTMQRPLIVLSHIACHPYLVRTPLVPNSAQNMLLVDENIVKTSGKMIVLDQMLAKLKQGGHKVLIFSTSVMLLDIIEDFFIMRSYTYRRLDGSSKYTKREESVNDFNHDPSILAFLLSTRAGGLGLNLTAADTVIFYNRDWNPQVDIQAQDRCHRIGQTKPVMVYTLVTRNTIDERIIDCGTQKIILEKLVIRDGTFSGSDKSNERKDLATQLRDLRHVFQETKHIKKLDYSDAELDALLDRSDLHTLMFKEREP